MRRLYLEIYRAVLGVLVLFAVLVGFAFWHLDGPREPRRRLDAITRFAEATIPAPDAGPARLEAWARAVAEPFELDLSIYDATGERLVSVGEPLPLPSPSPSPNLNSSSSSSSSSKPSDSRFLTRNGHDHSAFALTLADGRSLVVRGDAFRRPFAHFLAALVLLAVATALAAHPIARGLTRRLELLKTQAEALGSGRLAARVPVSGRDEVAELARAFNAAAERIERLVADKTRLLAQTSHELRSPLARVRAALELIGESPRPELVARAGRDLEELDQLIGELLVASRLDAPEHRLERERVDLLALAAEEAARLSAAAGDEDRRVEVRASDRAGPATDPTCVDGDPRLLRRCLRNLLENALRHGAPPVRVEVAASPRPGFVRVFFEDAGPGVPAAERERIFEPFYRPPGQSSAPGGVGLGLALVRQIAQHHGGQVACEAPPIVGPREPAGGIDPSGPTARGRGTRFLLDLPASKD